jgi:hypothetical protein
MIHKLLHKPKALSVRSHRGIRRYVVCWLLLAAIPASAQRVSMSDLLTYMSLPAEKFDACMFQKGFVCYKSTGGLNGWTCLFAYNGNSLMLRPSDAMALMQYSRNSRSDLLMYQIRSKDDYELLQKELVRLGYNLEPVASDRLTYVLANTVITFQKTDSANGISSNYEGYQVALAHRRY